MALRWFRKSAAAGNTLAMTNLGLLYENGHGVPKDHDQALEWFRQAAS